MAPEVKTTVVCAVMAINFFTSLSIVLLNKYIFKKFDIGPVGLIAFHQACTTVFGYLWHLCGGFTLKSVRVTKVLPLALFFCGYVLFTNLSLQVNTVGTYQILKILTDPLIIFLEQYFYKASYSFKIKMSLVPMVLGVLINSYYDFQFSVLGTFWGGCGILCTALNLIHCSRKQHELELSSPQLLMYQAPLSTLFFCTLMLFEEFTLGQALPQKSNVINITSMAMGDMVMVLSTGIVAYLVNWSSYWIIGKTSIITFAVFSKLKLVTTLVVGYLVFDDSLNAKQFCGIILTLLGVAYYTYLKTRDKLANQSGSAGYRKIDKVQLIEEGEEC